MKFVILISVLIIIAGFGCRENAVNTDGSKGAEFLAAEDVGVTDVWLRIKLPFSRIQQPVTLKRDSTTIFRSTITAQDTLVTDEHLLPNHTYTYTLSFHIGFNSVSEAYLIITTLDSTSHNFMWETYILSNAGGDISDVAFISDTNIWAVGEMYMRDSSGIIEDQPYGIARWDGVKWTRQKIFYHDYGTFEKRAGRLNCIYAFGPNDIYVCSYANLLHWDGIIWTEKAFFMTGIPFNGQVFKMWASDRQHIYCAGRNGAIYFFDGTTWQKLNTGTTFDITDIYGAKIPQTGEVEIYALAVQDDYPPVQTEIHRIHGTTVNKVATLPKVYFSIWFLPGKKYYLGGDGIMWKNAWTDTSWHDNPIGTITRFGTGCIRGTGINDIFTTGSYFEVAHYNGYSWYNYKNQIPSEYGTLSRFAFNGNTIVAGGYIDQEATIIIGKR
jgi:hypothetical protein